MKKLTKTLLILSCSAAAFTSLTLAQIDEAEACGGDGGAPACNIAVDCALVMPEGSVSNENTNPQGRFIADVFVNATGGNCPTGPAEFSYSFDGECAEITEDPVMEHQATLEGSQSVDFGTNNQVPLDMEFDPGPPRNCQIGGDVTVSWGGFVATTSCSMQELCLAAPAPESETEAAIDLRLKSEDGIVFASGGEAAVFEYEVTNNTDQLFTGNFELISENTANPVQVSEEDEDASGSLGGSTLSMVQGDAFAVDFYDNLEDVEQCAPLPDNPHAFEDVKVERMIEVEAGTTKTVKIVQRSPVGCALASCSTNSVRLSGAVGTEPMVACSSGALRVDIGQTLGGLDDSTDITVIECPDAGGPSTAEVFDGDVTDDEYGFDEDLIDDDDGRRGAGVIFKGTEADLSTLIYGYGSDLTDEMEVTDGESNASIRDNTQTARIIETLMVNASDLSAGDVVELAIPFDVMPSEPGSPYELNRLELGEKETGQDDYIVAKGKIRLDSSPFTIFDFMYRSSVWVTNPANNQQVKLTLDDSDIVLSEDRFTVHLAFEMPDFDVDLLEVTHDLNANERIAYQETCDDGVDNTGNGLIGCDDPYCENDPYCTGEDDGSDDDDTANDDDGAGGDDVGLGDDVGTGANDSQGGANDSTGPGGEGNQDNQGQAGSNDGEGSGESGQSDDETELESGCGCAATGSGSPVGFVVMLLLGFALMARRTRDVVTDA